MTATAAATVIDDVTFLAMSGALAALLIGVLFAPRLGRSHSEYVAAQLAKAQRKRAERKERGSDRYFEELRTIDAQIANLEQDLAAPRWHRMRRLAGLAFASVGSMLLAMQLLIWFVPRVSRFEAPASMNPDMSFIVGFVGAAQWLSASEPNNKLRWLNILMGCILMLLAIIIFFTP